MTYRPSPRLVAANAALVHLLRRQEAAKASCEPLPETAAEEENAARAAREEIGHREERDDQTTRGQRGHDGPKSARQTGEKGK